MVIAASNDLLNAWPEGEIRLLPLPLLGERYRRYRLPDAAAEAAMAGALTRYGQLSPLAVFVKDDTIEVLDGFKRLTAARSISGFSELQSRRLSLNEREAKAAILALNSASSRVKELEEAWVVQALVREDGLSQLQAAELLGRHKSWISRRLALLERLSAECQEDLRLGLLSFSVARQLTRLPAGNQVETLAAARRAGLTAQEVSGMVDLLAGCASRSQVEFILGDPQRALRQAKLVPGPVHDPRLSSAGNRVLRQLNFLFDALGRMESWLRHRGRCDLSVGDRRGLAPHFTRLARDARVVAELVDDLMTESELP